jgi:hypothetical protein
MTPPTLVYMVELRGSVKSFEMLRSTAARSTSLRAMAARSTS